MGVMRGYVYLLRDGVGSADVVALLAGTGQSRDPGATKRIQIQNWIDDLHIATGRDPRRAPP